MNIETITFKNITYTNDEFIQFILDNYDLDKSLYYRNVDINKDISAINEFKVGDLISAYRTGFHEIVGFDCRLDITYTGTKRLHIIVDYMTKFSKNGIRKKSKYIHVCDLGYAKIAKEYIESEKIKLQNIINNLENLLG